ncbi:MAG: tRNA-dihydrouridine synthase [Parcubacteria group bacterium]|nr:tRNA-dihydrouridine synthase [Parcubacteria group bacterium]
MKSFWKELPKPFFTLAPLADVTDPAFRRLVAQYGKPDVTWTEFVSADGLYYTREKKGMKDEENPLVRDFGYSEGERPIVAQIFGSNPETIEYASALAASLGFDGIDINMGCPDKSIEKQGAGAAMIKTPELVAPIMEAARRGAASGKNGAIPVSIKTRIGYNQEVMNDWLPVVLAAKPDALTVHLRTRKEMSKVEAHWELMARAVELRNAHSPETLIIGNGDVKDLADARAKAETTGADGIMLGRAIFGNPWLFTDRLPEDISPRERLEALQKLTLYFGELRPAKSAHLLKKHFKSFVSGWDGAAQIRAQLMDAPTLEAIHQIIEAERIVLL